MTLRETLAELDALARALPRAANLPLISQCRVLADAWAGPEPAPAAAARDFVEAIRAALVSACVAGGPGSVPNTLLQNTPLALWNGDPQVANLGGLLERYLDQAGSQKRWLVPLIEAWLRDFGPDRTGLAAAGRRIATKVRVARDPRLLGWREAHEAFALFNAEAGPQRIAHALLHASEPVEDVLRRARMDDPIRADGQYFRACIHAILAALPDALRGPSGLESWRRAVEVLQISGLTRDRRGQERIETRLRFADLAGPMAGACLAPWLGGAPAAISREPVKAFLLDMLGDPRLQPQRWAGVVETATALMCSWLAEATLDAFFDLISLRNDDAQWRSRQRFWRACFNKSGRAEVWVVLGSGLAGWANTHPLLRKSHAKLGGSSKYQNQAVLLIRIDDLMLSEWSNVGALRAWLKLDGRCPKMYLQEYDDGALRAPSLDFPQIAGKSGSSGGIGLWHRKPLKYEWQDSAAALLKQRVGLNLTRADYA